MIPTIEEQSNINKIDVSEAEVFNNVRMAYVSIGEDNKVIITSIEMQPGKAAFLKNLSGDAS